MGSETIGAIACDHAGCDESLTAPTRTAAELEAVLQEGWYYDARSNTAYCPCHRRERNLADTAPVPIPGCTCGAAHRPHCETLRGRGEPTCTPWIDGPERGVSETAACSAPHVVTDDDEI